LLGEAVSASESLVLGLKTPHRVEVEEEGGLLTEEDEPQLKVERNY
jgi:hypothetical protein